MPEFDDATVNALAALGANATAPTTVFIETEGFGDANLPAKIPMLWDRDSQRAISVREEVDKWRARPLRRRGTSVAGTIDSFCNLVNRHKTEDSVVFGDLNWRRPTLLAVIDYHPIRNPDDKQDRADWGQNLISYEFPMSEEWSEWSQRDAAVMSQEEFGYLIEDRVQHLAAPTDDEQAVFGEMLQTKLATPSELMMLSRGLSMTVKAAYKDHKVIQSGESEISYVEEHADATGANKLKVPGAFMIEIPIFHSGGTERILVRLRYRAREGRLSWFYQLYRPDMAISKVLEAEREFVEQETSLPFYEGKPAGGF